jgi:SAM-dependent methyltransferase
MGTRYEQHAKDGLYNAHYDRPAVLSVLGDVSGKRVLDAGCGPGFYCAELLTRGASVSAFDASPVMVDLARSRLGSAVQVDEARLGEQLPYASGQFDAVVCALAIHYVDDRRAAFGELCRVLRTGGRLVVSTQHPTADWLWTGGSYFDTVLETGHFGLASGDEPVEFWRIPLTQLCAEATGGGFLMRGLHEPRPTQQMRVLDHERYEKLNSEPGFLILDLLKPNS